MNENIRECFDYLMNTRSTYEQLRVAVEYFERRAKRYGRTVAEELKAWHCYGMVRGSPARWVREASTAMLMGRKDYVHTFGHDDAPYWVHSSPTTFNDPVALMEAAMEYRDRWN